MCSCGGERGVEALFRDEVSGFKDSPDPRPLNSEPLCPNFVRVSKDEHPFSRSP